VRVTLEIVPDERRIAVTLVNGRSHILQLPAGLEVEAASEALTCRRQAGELGWEEAERDWLPTERGGVWVRKSAIVEIAVVDYPEDPSAALTFQY
jgi:hypothetical protein